MNPYAVIFTYSFDRDVAVYLFATEDEAKAFLTESYQEELRIDTEENPRDVESEISTDRDDAKITTLFDDHEDVTEFRLGSVYL